MLSFTQILNSTRSLIIFESFIAGCATLLGALMVCSFGRPRIRLLAAFMGFAAGVMTCIVLLDLLPYSYSYGSLLYTALGFWLGVFLIKILKMLINKAAKIIRNKKNKKKKSLSWKFKPKQDPVATDEENQTKQRLYHFLQLGILVAIGIALHDLPEGMAIAAGHTAHRETGLMLAFAIGLHNIPEGIAAATPLVMAGIRRRKIIISMFLISLFTPLGAGLGLLLLSLGDALISVLLALSAGAMISIVLSDLWPEAWLTNRLTSSAGFLLGLGLMLFLTFFMHV